MAKRSGERLYRKSGTFYGWYYAPGTRERVVVCTRTRDREAARAFMRKLERDAYEATLRVVQPRARRPTP